MSFAYLRPESLDAALEALAEPHSMAIGGGTDLLVWIEEGLASPRRVVDLRALPGAGEITLRADGSVRLGAAVRIADLAEHAELRARFPVLADAAASVGTPALRNMGTLGGNLAQRPRCWYLRGGVSCFKNGGTECAAFGGEHVYHGIIAGGTCHAVHPSDPAVALEALDAHVEVAGPGGATRRLTIAALFAGAAANPRAELTLKAGEVITAVELPAAAAGGTQHWEKMMQRGAWDFALVACAAARRADGTVRIALGGVAAGPWRVALSVEEDVASGALDDESLDALAERALYDAEPLGGNRYKVTMAQAALRRAMRRLIAAG
ncbi:MAG: FAD binding domain-containing protein [Gemmatimonadota bacterium]|nr:FAD binding domain-containing protein [Gemmatimonadota bacterium]